MITLLTLAFALVTPGSETQVEERPFVLGQRLEIRSEVLGESRPVLVFRSQFAAPGERVPTIYLLDGPAHFRYVSGLVHSLSAVGSLPPCLVIGVENTERWRDLTPTHSEEARSSGGGAAFLRFLGEELVPYVDEHYSTSGYRVLIGHSLGGLVAIESVLTQPGLFDAVISQSPSLEWNGEAIVERTRSWLAGKPSAALQLYVSRANEWELRAPFASFTALLEGAPESLDWTAESFPDEHHGSVVVPASEHGLRWVFATWTATPNQLAAMRPAEVESFYERAARRFEAPRPIPENALLEGVMQALHGLQDPAAAVELAYFAEDLFPGSPYCALSLGEALEAAGEREEARAAYERTLERLPADDDHHRARALRGLARLKG